MTTLSPTTRRLEFPPIDPIRDEIIAYRFATLALLFAIDEQPDPPPTFRAHGGADVKQLQPRLELGEVTGPKHTNDLATARPPPA